MECVRVKARFFRHPYDRARLHLIEENLQAFRRQETHRHPKRFHHGIKFFQRGSPLWPRAAPFFARLAGHPYALKAEMLAGIAENRDRLVVGCSIHINSMVSADRIKF